MSNYNDSNNRGCRIGNWVEEEVLKQVTGMARYNRDNPRGTDTFSRLILHDTRLEPKQYKSATHDAYSKPQVSRAQATKGPRERMMEKLFHEKACELINNDICMAEKKLNDQGTYDSEAKSQFEQKSIDFSTKRIPRGRQQKQRVVVDETQVPDYPVTFHTQNMILGNVPRLTPATSSNQFNRNTLFTNSVHHSEKIHFEDQLDKVYNSSLDTTASNLAPGLGSELTVKAVLKEAREFVQRCDEVSLSSLPLQSNGTPLDATSVWEIFKHLGLKLTARNRRALVVWYEGKSEGQLLKDLGLIRDEPTGDEALPEANETHTVIEIEFTMPDLTQSCSLVPINPRKVKSLNLPHDDHIVRALLRRHTNLVPKSIEKVKFV